MTYTNLFILVARPLKYTCKMSKKQNYSECLNSNVE